MDGGHAFENQQGKLVRITDKNGLANSAGWWNSITGADLNGDGRTDYILGNLGRNSRYQFREGEPLQIHWADFDANGSMEAIISEVRDGKRVPLHPRDDLFQRLPSLKKTYPSYDEYARADLASLIDATGVSETQQLSVDQFASSILLNTEEGFQRIPLPNEAQMAPVYGALVADFNGDENPDLFLTGNNYLAEAINGPYDASYGLLLHGDGKGGFDSPPQSPWISGDLRGLTHVRLQSSGKTLAVALKNDANMAWLDIFPVTPTHFAPPTVDQAAYMELHYRSGTIQKKNATREPGT